MKIRALGYLVRFSLVAVILGSATEVKADFFEGFSNAVKIAPEDDEKEIRYKAAHLKPTPRQLAWQSLEFTAFVHFGMNTFTGREWGDGTEDPALFDPKALDADQWVKACRSAGIRLLVVTGKHHDGFCLWPSRYTEHSVKNSPWRGGNGDLVREVQEACQREGLGFGVYLSPWDRHEPSYGDSPRYNAFYRNQLEELLSQYGEVAEVWMDGACAEGPNGKKQVYDFESYFRLIRRLQPDAVISILGPDVRWVGNEAGEARESEWSVIPAAYDTYDPEMGDWEKIKKASFLVWYPSQTDVSIRPGWFYHASQDEQVKSLEHLLEIYYESVGGNSQLLLNIPPDRRGLLHENDVKRLAELGDYLQRTFSNNLARGAKVKASHVRGQSPDFSADHIIDGNPDTYWTCDDWTESAWIELDLGEEKTFNQAMLQEHIRIGQRIEAFSLEAFDGRGWSSFAGGTVIGYKRLLRFPEVTASKVRIRILSSRFAPTLSAFGLFKAPILLSAPQIVRNRAGQVTLSVRTPGPHIFYTLDGSDPGPGSLEYSSPFPLSKGGVVRAVAVVKGSKERSAITHAIYDICKERWLVLFVDDAVRTLEAEKAIDDNPSTMWHTEWREGAKPHPHEIQVDLGEELLLFGFTYLPRSDGNVSGTIKKYDFYVSHDGKTWQKKKDSEAFPNIKNSPVLQEVWFDEPCAARYIRFVSRTEVNGKAWASIAELGVLTRRRD